MIMRILNNIKEMRMAMKEEYWRYAAFLVLLITLFVQLPALVVGGALELFELPIVLSFLAFVIIATVLLFIRAFYNLDEKRGAKVDSLFHKLILLSLIVQLIFSIVYTNLMATVFSAVMVIASIIGVFYGDKKKSRVH